MHNSQKPKSNVCFHNWITKTRSSFYFLPINAQTNISFNLFFWEWTFLIHQSPFDRTFEAWKPIAINQNYNQKEFLNTHHNYILSPWQGCRYRRGRGGNGCQKFWQITNGVEGQIMPTKLLPALPPPGFSDLPTALQGHIAQWVACASYCMYIASNAIYMAHHALLYLSKEAKKHFPLNTFPWLTWTYCYLDYKVRWVAEFLGTDVKASYCFRFLVTKEVLFASWHLILVKMISLFYFFLLCNVLLKTVAFIAGKKNPAIQKFFIRFSIKNFIANISLYALSWPKLKFGCYHTFEIIF